MSEQVVESLYNEIASHKEHIEHLRNEIRRIIDEKTQIIKKILKLTDQRDKIQNYLYDFRSSTGNLEFFEKWKRKMKRKKFLDRKINELRIYGGD